jgi:hypothetical protein
VRTNFHEIDYLLPKKTFSNFSYIFFGLLWIDCEFKSFFHIALKSLCITKKSINREGCSILINHTENIFDLTPKSLINVQVNQQHNPQ